MNGNVCRKNPDKYIHVFIKVIYLKCTKNDYLLWHINLKIQDYNLDSYFVWYFSFTWNQPIFCLPKWLWWANFFKFFKCLHYLGCITLTKWLNFRMRLLILDHSARPLDSARILSSILHPPQLWPLGHVHSSSNCSPELSLCILAELARINFPQIRHWPRIRLGRKGTM